MKKIKIKASITSNNEKYTEEVIGNIESNIINYQEKDKTMIYLDINKNELIRENNFLLLKYKFNLNEISTGTIYIKELNNYTEVQIKTNKIIKDEYKYYVEYMLDSDKFIYELEYTEV